MLTPREAFKAGFLRKCAEEGLTPEETLSLVKTSLETVKSGMIGEMLAKPIDAATRALGTAAGTVGNWGINTAATGLLAGPPLLGAAAGLGLSRLTDLDDTDVDALRKQELIELYKEQVAQLQAKAKSRQNRRF